MMELNISGSSKRGEPKLKFYLAVTNDIEVDSHVINKDAYIGAICIIDESYQADFDLKRQDIDSLIGFLQGMKEHITENK